MKIADKNLRYYWGIIKWPLVVYIVANILLGVLGFISPLFPLLILPILILVITYIGWITVKEKDGSVVNATISGIFFGLIMGIISAVLIVVAGFVVMNLPPLPAPSGEISSNISAVNVTSKLSALVHQIIFIYVIIGAIIVPIFYIIISAIISTISGFIAKQTMKKPFQ